MAFVFSTVEDMPELAEISRCLTNLLNIPSGTLPLARGLGISWANLSQIPADLENDIATEIIEKVEQYEPRVSVSEVTFEYDDEGEATITIMLDKGE